MLLINKFRTKLNINVSTEGHLDLMIKEEVAKLLTQGNAVDKQLTQLDKKLTAAVNAERKTKGEPSVKAGGFNDFKFDGSRFDDETASCRSSVRTQRQIDDNQSFQSRIKISGNQS